MMMIQYQIFRKSVQCEPRRYRRRDRRTDGQTYRQKEG